MIVYDQIMSYQSHKIEFNISTLEQNKTKKLKLYCNMTSLFARVFEFNNARFMFYTTFHF